MYNFTIRNLFRKLDIDKQFFKTIECIYKTLNNTTLIKTNETFDERSSFKDTNAKTIACNCHLLLVRKSTVKCYRH